MKKLTFLFCMSLFISVSACQIDNEYTGSVYKDHQGVPYSEGNGDVLDGMDFYFGNFHSHTGNSDGEGTPAEAYEWARDVAGFDFYAITDHAFLLSNAEWDDTGIQSNYYTQNGDFLAIRGFEWSHLVAGHVNIFNTDEFTNLLLAVSNNMTKLHDWLDSNNGYAQFNHPGRENGVFDDFSYSLKTTDNFMAVETGNKGEGNTNGEYLPYYTDALDKGWRLAPTANQDNHSLSTNSHRTAAIMRELTIPDLFDAMENRRIYSSDDPDMRLIFKVGSHWMGSVVNISSGLYTFTIQIVDNEPISKIELITQTGTVSEQILLTGTDTVVGWSPIVSVSQNSYYFIKVTGIDTNNDDPSHDHQVTVSAPIWLKVE